MVGTIRSGRAEALSLMHFLQRFTQLLTGWVLPRPLLVLVLALALAVASILVTVSQLDFQTDQLELISPDHPLVALSDRLQPFKFGGKTTFTIVVHSPWPERSVAFLNALAARVEQDTDHFQDFFYRVDPELVKQWVFLYLDKDELYDLRDNISKYAGLLGDLAERPELLTFLTSLNQEMATRMVGELFTGFLDEGDGQEAGGTTTPMGLDPLIRTLEGLSGYLHGTPRYFSPWVALFKDTGWDLDLEGYFWEGGKRYLLAFILPRKTGDGFDAGTASLQHLRRLIGEVRAAYPEVQAGVTGQGALNTDEMATAMSDMNQATGLSLAGVLLLMVLFSWSFRRPLAEMLSTAIALCWTMGFTTLAIGHLNILSIVFAPLLCGLGVDFGIHWFARFEEEERKDDSRTAREVIREVTNRSGSAICLAGLSTALCFLPFVLTGFNGLIELGIIVGVGLLFTLFADFTVLPALTLVLGSSKGKPAFVMGANGKDLLRFTPLNGRVILGGAMVFTLVAAWGARQVKFDLNPLRLQTATAESVVWEKTLIEHSERSLLSASVFASSPEDAKAKSERLNQLSTVSAAESVFDLLPQDQDDKIELVGALFRSIPEVKPVPIVPEGSDVRPLVNVLERIRFKMQDEQAAQWGAEKPLEEQMAKVREIADEIIRVIHEHPATVVGPLTDYRQRFHEDLLKTWEFFADAASVRRMGMMDVPKFLRDWFYHDGEYLIRVFPKESIWEGEILTRFVTELQSVEPEVAGEPVSLHVFANAYMSACVQASIYALVVIMFLLLLTLRRFSLALLALIPLLVGTLWTVGIMGWAGIDFNLANGIFMPLVVGAGVEYGVIILNRWREGSMLPGHLPFSTGKGVILAALTTTVGFGALMISHHQGIFSLGFIAWAGSLCVLVAAIILIPAILAFGAEKPGEAGGGS